MPNVVGSRCFAIRRAPTAIGVQWVSTGGEFVLWNDHLGTIQSWRYVTVFRPGVGSISANGQTPSLKSNSPKFIPGTGSITFTGQAVGTGNRIATPGVGSITAAGLTPSLISGGSRTFQPATGAIVAAGLTPSVKRNTFFQPAQGTISINGQQIGGWKVSWARVKIN